MNDRAFPTISEHEFYRFQKLIHEIAGIDLPPSKKMLVAGRLSKRLRYYGLPSYGAYYKLVNENPRGEEFQLMVDLLTTNETYFFREPDHFTFLQKQVLPQWKGKSTFRAWSAACSSGEEAYSLAMVLMDFFGNNHPWEVMGSDLSHRMLEIAKTGLYPLDNSKNLSAHYLSQYCLKGVRSQSGTFLVDKAIRQRVGFRQINLNQELPRDLGQFDLIFLRNVLIYFNVKTKQDVVRRIVKALRPGGHCFIGHAESLLGITDEQIHASLYSVAPTIYRKR